jgi:hypothetical protein
MNNALARGPFGLNSARGKTMAHERTVLAVVHTVTAGTRLGDVVPMLEQDPRIQMIYTHPPCALFSAGTPEFLSRLDGVTVPWETAITQRFDLALAAHPGLLEWVHAPIASLPHGTVGSKYESRWGMNGPAASRSVAGLDRSRLVHHGRVIAAAHVVPTREQLDLLRASCPEAAAVAVIAGDPCYDRLAASANLRLKFREKLQTRARQLITVTSTWGPGALLQEHRDLVSELTQALPEGSYQVAAIIHPNAWAWHSPRQLRSWYIDALERGLKLIHPEEGWRATVAASDVVIGDHGSVTAYAAAAGIPVMLGAHPADEIAPGSLAMQLASFAPKLRRNRPYPPQFAATIDAWTQERHAAVRTRVTDFPGQAAALIRSHLYRMMKLAEPPGPPQTQPVPAPQPVSLPETFGGRW